MNAPLVKLGDVCEVVLGGTPKTAVSEFWGGSIPWVTPKDMRADKHRFIAKTERTLTEAGLASGSTLLPAGSLILSTRAPIGYLRINTVPMCTNQGCKSLVPKPGVNVSYLYYNLLLRRGELNDLGSGSTFLELGTPALRNLELPLPSLAEQERIVAHLERTLGAIDAMEAKFREMAETAERHFRATLAESFAALSSAPVAKLGEVCEVTYGYAFASEFLNSEAKGCPIIRIQNVLTGITTTYTTEACNPRYLIRKGDLLIGMSGAFNIARWQGAEAFLNQRVCRLAPKLGVLGGYLLYRLPEYLAQIWEAKSFTTLKNLSKQELEGLSFPLPSLAEQERVVARLERAEGVSRRVVALAQEGVAQCGVYRRAVLSEAFGGGEGGGDE